MPIYNSHRIVALQVDLGSISQQTTAPATPTGSTVVGVDQCILVDLASELAKHFSLVSDTSPESVLVDIEETSFWSTLHDLQSVDAGGDNVTILLREGVYAQIDEGIQAIETCTMQAKNTISASEGKFKIFNAGACC